MHMDCTQRRNWRKERKAVISLPAKMKMDVITDVFPALIFKDAKCTPVYPHRMLVLHMQHYIISLRHSSGCCLLQLQSTEKRLEHTNFKQEPCQNGSFSSSTKHQPDKRASDYSCTNIRLSFSWKKDFLQGLNSTSSCTWTHRAMRQIYVLEHRQYSDCQPTPGGSQTCVAWEEMPSDNSKQLVPATLLHANPTPVSSPVATVDQVTNHKIQNQSLTASNTDNPDTCNSST
jgi:hypothetical protein